MRGVRAGLLLSAAAHAVVAGAIFANHGTNSLPTASSPLAVDLVAIAPPEPVMRAAPVTAAPALVPPTPASPPAAAPSAKISAGIETPFATAVRTPADETLPTEPRPPAPRHAPKPREVAFAAPHPAASPHVSRAATGTSAPPAAPASAATQAATASPPADWLRAIAAWLATHRTYPDQARREGEQGTVVLRLVVARDGTVHDAALLEGSGHADLDRASLAAVRNARLPPAPSPDAPAELTLRVPIRYALQPSN